MRRLVAGFMVTAALMGACIGRDGSAATGSYTPVTERTGDWFRSACSVPLPYLKRIRQGTLIGRSPDLTILPREPNNIGSFVSTTHSGPWDFLQEVPLLFYGPGFIRPSGRLTLGREATIADIAPTLAELLHTPFPEDRPGRPIMEALAPPERRPRPPRLIVTVVWDGGGWNVLEAWPRAWPFLAELMEGGTSVAGTVVGSSPSVTPAIHANIGTGTFPNQHGIVSISQREGDRIVYTYERSDPKRLEVHSLADIYDPRTGNEAKVGMFAEKNWMLGMIGHGAAIPEGDRDVAVMVRESGDQLVSSGRWYTLPSYLEDLPELENTISRVDQDDGEQDGMWLGKIPLNDLHDVLNKTPVWTAYENELVTRVLKSEGFGQDVVGDLFYVNYKSMDHLGHIFNMLSKEVRVAVEYADQALEELVGFLNAEVGKRRWVLVMTADHGMGVPADPTGAWPIGMDPLQSWIAEHVGLEVDELFAIRKPHGFWFNRDVLKANGITLEDIAELVLDYRLRDNATDIEDVPDDYRHRLDELLFTAAIPTHEMERVWRCAKRRASRS